VNADFDLLIIGGGMVGACMASLAASEPALDGLRIALLEANPPSAPPDNTVDLRVSAISRASQRILDSFGAWSRLPPQHLSPYCEMVVWDASGQPRGAASIHFSASETSEPDLGHIVENRRLQWAMMESQPFRRVTVLRAELAELELEASLPTATLADGRRVTAQLIVGADGAGSLSRKLAGIETVGWDYDQRAFVTHVRTEHPHAQTAWQRFLPDGPIAFLPLADGRSSIVWSATPEHAERLASCADDRLGAELRDAIGGVLGDVEVAAPRAHFPLRLTHARSYCKARFALVGDAAHAVHPLAGQGVNLGFMDCAALVQTLADERAAGGTVESMAELRVLRRYERWRKSENVVALGLIDSLKRLFGAQSTIASALRRTGLSIVDRSDIMKKFLISRAMGTAGELPRRAEAHGARSALQRRA
jgi:2-octaprenylphenol hydroxylase